MRAGVVVMCGAGLSAGAGSHISGNPEVFTTRLRRCRSRSATATDNLQKNGYSVVEFIAILQEVEQKAQDLREEGFPPLGRRSQ